MDKDCLFIEQLLKKKKTQTFLVINVKSFPDEVCSWEKRAGYTSHLGGDVLPAGAGVPTSPSVPGRAAGSSRLLSHHPPPSLSHKLHQPKTHYLQTTGSHITTLPVLKARTWSFKGGNKTTDHPTQTKRRLQRNTKVCTAIKR